MLLSSHITYVFNDLMLCLFWLNLYLVSKPCITVSCYLCPILFYLLDKEVAKLTFFMMIIVVKYDLERGNVVLMR